MKIAHLSDIHCDSSKEWDRYFGQVKSLLVEESPDLIIITGDSVDSPGKDLVHFTKSLKSLYTALAAKHETYIMTLPGNHDVAFKGLRLGRFGDRAKQFKHVFRELQFPYQDELVTDQNIHLELAEKIFSDFNIGIIPFDSNYNNDKLYFAQGRVDSPGATYEMYKSKFVDIARKKKIDFESCVKIGALHHHLLPLPSTRGDEAAEPGMILQNAYEFIEASQEYKIDLIIHGHRHVSGTIEYKSHAQNGHTQFVSACASSSKVDTLNNREVKFIQIGDSGSLTIKSFMADHGTSYFKPVSNGAELIGYGDRRKIRYKDKSLLPRGDAVAVRSMLAKTKTVAIQHDGNAWVGITMEDIQWNDIDDDSEIGVTEQLRADIGRISYGWTNFSESSNADYLAKGEYWLHPEGEKYVEVRPCNSEVHKLVVKADPTIPLGEKAFCKINYHLFNGFMLSNEDHLECYGSDWNVKVRDETCSIQANYPTDLLELVVSFPDEKSFPKRSCFKLHASGQLSEDEEKSLVIMKCLYNKRKDETDFLRRKCAIRYRPDLLEVAVVIKYPQPDMLYTLRWGLPSRNNMVNIDRGKMAVGEKLRTECLNISSRSAGRLYSLFSEKIKETLGSDCENALDVLLLGYDKNKGLLAVGQGPAQYHRAAKVCVGRGVAGKAFRTREACYWEKPATGEYNSDELSQEPEKIIDNFDPKSILALPIMYPRINQSEPWDFAKDAYCPVVFMVVLIDNSITGPLSKAMGADDLSHEEGVDIAAKLIQRRDKLTKGAYGVLWHCLKNSMLSS